MENVNNNIPVTSGIARPWQGTLLGVLSIIGAVALGIAIIFSLIAIVGGSAIISQAQTGGNLPLGSLFATLGAFLAVPLILFLILQIFIVLGVFKGQKWSIILLLIFSILALLGAISNKAIITILMDIFIIYAEYACLKSSFYAGGKMIKA